eukprot:CAMPEP_0194589300 /NCGR_PEP_ID=MMETSP0292-20121207/20523_1 /TAXON_ID=39354 /ORGANISM="Heterosigma akashiwo, Strain CCMP2393" /LENGTH=54 /DNA_ID=CAMNT_0039446427 /DNA_START=994 /DNA_END=1155 /DNA_ORIENTATION=-
MGYPPPPPIAPPPPPIMPPPSATHSRLGAHAAATHAAAGGVGCTVLGSSSTAHA